MPKDLPTTSRSTPSSGTQSYSHRRVSIHRWSYDQNGNVTSKTRESVQEAPYELPPKEPEEPEEIKAGPSDSPAVHPRPYSDRSPSVRVLSPPPLVAYVPLAMVHDIILALLRNKTTVELTVESICIAYELNPFTTESIMQAVRENLSPVDEPQTVLNAIEPNSCSSVPTNVASTSTASLFTFTPIKQSRPFQGGSTTWYSTRSMRDIDAPPAVHEPTIGDLYVHTNIDTEARCVWLYQDGGVWQRIDLQKKIHHPNLQGRVLSMRKDGTPNWVTGASYITMKGRKERAIRDVA